MAKLKELQECEDKSDELTGELLVRAKKLCKQCGYDPENIGSTVLKACGFNVRRFMSGGIAVHDGADNLLYYSSY